MFSMIQKILVPNKKNLNKRIYTKKSIQKIISDYKKYTKLHGDFYGVFRKEPDLYEYPGNDVVRIKDIAFLVKKLYFNGYYLLGDIQVLETNAGKDLQKYLEHNQICFRPVCWGSVQPNREVEIDGLVTINAIFKKDDSFRNLLK